MKILKKKVLILGSEGYIGSELCNYLKKDKNIILTKIDNKLYFNNSIKQNNNFINKDLRFLSNEYISKFDVIIMLAGLSNNPIDNLFPEKAYNVVYKYTQRIALLCKKYKIKFIWPSSCSVYGNSLSKSVNENSTTNPLTYYSKNKIKIENFLKKISDKKFHPIILRISTVFGFSNSLRLDTVTNMLMMMAIENKEIILNSDGSALRPLVSLNGVVKAFYYAIFFKSKKMEIINVGTNSNNFSILKLAKKISKLNKNIKIKINSKNIFFKDSLVNKKDSRSYKVNFNKIKKKFPKFSDNVNHELKNLQNKLKKYKEKKILKNRKFYRLKQISFYLRRKRISKDLFIKKIK